MRLTEEQAQKLAVRPHTQLSPYLETCCLRVSANVSYQHAQEDVELFTGLKVAAKTQQRLVHRHNFDVPKLDVPVEELSVDGGKIRIRTPVGQPCIWKDYKGVCLHDSAIGAFFQDNAALIDWVNNQPLALILTCLGDGHDGIWNIITQLAPTGQRREIQGLVSFGGKLI